jgi:hypothetical protein
VRAALALLAASLIVGAGCGAGENAAPRSGPVDDPGFILFNGYQPNRRASGAEIWAMRPDGTGLRELEITSDDFSFSPGGQFMATKAFRWEDDEEPPESLVFVSRPDGSEQRRVPLPKPGGAAGWPSASADGERVALVVSDDPMFAGDRDLWAGSVDGENFRQLSSLGKVSSNAWSPDGEHIAFANGYGEPDVYVVRADGTELRHIAEGWAPAWSPDGKQIAFAGRRGGIHIVDLGGGKPSVVTREGGIPAWSPDGRRLAFLETTPCGEEVTCYRVVVVDVSGAHRRTIGPQLGEAGYLAWTTASLPTRNTSVDLHDVDWANVTLPGSVCGAKRPIRLRNGRAVVTSTRWADVPRVTVDSGWNPVVYGDVDGDGADEAALVVNCNNGGGTASGVLAYAEVIFTAGDHSPRVLGVVMPQSPSTYGAPLLQVEIHRGKIIAREAWYGCCDGTCCPSGRATTTWTYSDGVLRLGKTVVERQPKG